MTEHKHNFAVTVARKDLLSALLVASSLFDKPQINPLLTSVKITVNDSKLHIEASDGDLYLSQQIGATSKIEGKIIVPGKLLVNVIQNIPDEEINFIQQPGQKIVMLVGDNYNFALDLLEETTEHQHFIINEVESKNRIVIGWTKLEKIIHNTQFSVSKDETRYNLSGIYLHNNENSLVSAATDGHRLAVSAETVNQITNNENIGLILPKATTRILDSKILTNKIINSANIEISLSDSLIKFSNENFSLISKLIDGNFPDYVKLIPQNMTNKLVINRKLLLDAVNRVSIFTIDRFKAVTLILNQNQLEINAAEKGKGSAKEIINYSTKDEKICIFTGQDITIGFNYRYLTDVLSALSEDVVTIYLKDDQSPILVKVEDRTQDNFVIMPLKI